MDFYHQNISHPRRNLSIFYKIDRVRQGQSGVSVDAFDLPLESLVQLSIEMYFNVTNPSLIFAFIELEFNKEDVVLLEATHLKCRAKVWLSKTD